MELRKDPLTRSWVITGDDVPEVVLPPASDCRLCPGASGKDKLQQISSRASVQGGSWSARAVVHPGAIYHIEGTLDRRGEGIYDRMPNVGAHEILIENQVMLVSATSAFSRITVRPRAGSSSIPIPN